MGDGAEGRESEFSLLWMVHGEAPMFLATIFNHPQASELHAATWALFVVCSLPEPPEGTQQMRLAREGAVCNLGQILFALISLRVNTAVAPALQQLGKMSERVQAAALCLYVQEVL